MRKMQKCKTYSNLKRIAASLAARPAGAMSAPSPKPREEMKAMPEGGDSEMDEIQDEE